MNPSDKTTSLFEEAPLELTPEPAPPKIRPHKKAKAVWPAGKIKPIFGRG